MGKRRAGGWFLSGASLVGAFLMDRLLPDPLPYWLTAVLFAVVFVGFFGGLALAFWPERKKMAEDDETPQKPAALFIGKGANRNSFHGVTITSAGASAVVIHGDGNSFSNSVIRHGRPTPQPPAPEADPADPKADDPKT